MTLVLVSVGSNIEPEKNIPKALTLVRQMFPVTGTSRFYGNPAIGADGTPSGQADFINGMLKLETDESAESLRRGLRVIEKGLGRKRTADAYAPRTIDLDVVLWGDRVDPDLGLPDPGLSQHPHLYMPARDLVPNLVVPGTDVRIAALPDPGFPVVEPGGHPPPSRTPSGSGRAGAATGSGRDAANNPSPTPSSDELARLATRKGKARQAGGHGRRYPR